MEFRSAYLIDSSFFVGFLGVWTTRGYDDTSFVFLGRVNTRSTIIKQLGKGGTYGSK